MIVIHTTIDLPEGWHRMYQVRDEVEARDLVGAGVGYFLRSKIIRSCYLFVPVGERTEAA